MREEPIWKFSQMLAGEEGMFAERSTHSLTLCQTPHSLPAPRPPAPLQFAISPLPAKSFLSSSLRLAANNGEVVWYHLLPEGVEAAERLSSKPKHLYAVIHMIVIPHPSIPLRSASLSITHPLWSFFLSVRGDLPRLLRPGEVCISRYSICVWACVQRGRWFIWWEGKRAASSKVWQCVKEIEPQVWWEHVTKACVTSPPSPTSSFSLFGFP